jgi:hypothetical protein
MENRHQCPEALRDALCQDQKQRPETPISSTLREAICLVDTVRYLGVTLDKRLIWSKHIDRASKKMAQRLGALGPHLYSTSSLNRECSAV